ncbi:hypothetical protein GWI33_014341 [Rhynchophorus ferrugineus]|uniref:Phenoloxidase-activating factor 2 n=1 Tax=Rhynchophorus ferrugineus TaxID=354439 RepID=A0A834I2T2_RHYFE|nr:hypothetical protein GWI33_014341 [Rhynchophorus ferrugineus]
MDSVNNKNFLCVVYVLFVLFSTIHTLNNFSIYSEESHVQYCLCVPFWQCKEDFSGLDDNGLGVDVRERSSRPRSFSSCTGDLDVCCNVECGKKGNTVAPIVNKKIDKRILGDATIAEFAEFPWMLGILKGRVYKCGASLIHPKVSLTAAHCVSSPGDYVIRAGEWHWERQTEPLPHQDRDVDNIIIHEDFHPRSLQYDIALIILKKPFKLTRNVGIICLPQGIPKVNLSHCVVTGWGKNSFRKGTYQPVLKKVVLPVISRSKCTEILQNVRLGPMFTLHDSFICAGGETNKDACKGDGGGPLICSLEGKPQRYQQVGIVSWGLTCGMSYAPGVYVNLVMFSEWIDKKMIEHKLDIDIYKH